MTMTAPKTKVQETYICHKCGFGMIDRKLSIKKKGSVKYIKIRQCSICRHWYSLE